MSTKKIVMVMGVLVVAAVLITACGGAPTQPPVVETEPVATEEIMEKPAVEMPYLASWESSAHNATDAEPFRHWDKVTTAEIPITCAKCHSTQGYRDFLGADGSDASVVNAVVPARENFGIQCVACHNPVATNLDSVAFPGFEVDKDGNPVPYVVKGFGDSSRCLICHQGLESKGTVDAQIARFQVTDMDVVVPPIKDELGQDVRFGFRNIHYYASAVTLFGTEVKGGYEYEGKTYDARHMHVDGYDTCIGCHDSHTLRVKVEQCAVCHGDGVLAGGGLRNIRETHASTRDYDGDGNIEEGMYYEIQGLQEALMAQIKTYVKYTAKSGIVYDPVVYPYWFIDENEDGVIDKTADGNNAVYLRWTARLLKAAYNYQVSLKDPGAFAHGNKYIFQLLYDSIEDLRGDVSKFTRDDAGHFAGNTEPFRHWDETGTVPYSCVKCHTPGGLPEFIKNKGTTVVSLTGSTLTTGVGSMQPGNGFKCITCHDNSSWPDRYQVASVVFPSGKTVSLGGKDANGKFLADDSNVCILCHQGLESTSSVNALLRGRDDDVVDSKINFKNVHYFAAGATLFGGDVQGAYQYEGKEYVGQNQHGDPKGALNRCKDCHDVHSLVPKIENCVACHGDVKPEDIRKSGVDYDGDGDVSEGIKGEIATLADVLYAQIQAYGQANGNPITYNANAYPYFFGADSKGYAAWTPRLLKAAFNYQYSQKDPGAFAHNPKYVIQFLFDSIEDLGGNVSGYVRP